MDSIGTALENHLRAPLGALELDGAVLHVEISPQHREDQVAFRLLHGDKVARALAQHDAVASCELSADYLNIRPDILWLSDFVRNELAALAEWHPRAGTTCQLEHTSLTPVYPLNVATYRSSSLGMYIASGLVSTGCRVETHYWVQDLARQLDLLSNGLPEVELRQLPKADHAIGALFALRVLAGRVSEPDRRDRVARMFPSVSVSDLLQLDVGAPSTARRVAELCLEGIRATMERLAVPIDHFDFESALLDSYPPAALNTQLRSVKLGTRVLPLLKEDSSLPTYLVRNIAYYFDLLRGADFAVSVVPLRQHGVLESARIYGTYLAGRAPDDLTLVYFGDVVGSDRKPDSISDGRFHAVDDIIAAVTASTGQTEHVAGAALRLCLLSLPPTRAVRLPHRPEDIMRRVRRWSRALTPSPPQHHQPEAERYALLCAVTALDALQRSLTASFDPSAVVRHCDRLAEALTSHDTSLSFAVSEVVRAAFHSCVLGLGCAAATEAIF